MNCGAFIIKKNDFCKCGISSGCVVRVVNEIGTFSIYLCRNHMNQFGNKGVPTTINNLSEMDELTFTFKDERSTRIFGGIPAEENNNQQEVRTMTNIPTPNMKHVSVYFIDNKHTNADGITTYYHTGRESLSTETFAEVRQFCVDNRSRARLGFLVRWNNRSFKVRHNGTFEEIANTGLVLRPQRSR